MTLPILPSRGGWTALCICSKVFIRLIIIIVGYRWRGEELGAVAATGELRRCRTCCVLKLKARSSKRVYYHVHLHAAVEGWRSIISYDWQQTESDAVIDRTANEHECLLINDDVPS